MSQCYTIIPAGTLSLNNLKAMCGSLETTGIEPDALLRFYEGDGYEGFIEVDDGD